MKAGGKKIRTVIGPMKGRETRFESKTEEFVARGIYYYCFMISAGTFWRIYKI